MEYILNPSIVKNINNDEMFEIWKHIIGADFRGIAGLADVTIDERNEYFNNLRMFIIEHDIEILPYHDRENPGKFVGSKKFENSLYDYLANFINNHDKFVDDVQSLTMDHWWAFETSNGDRVITFNPYRWFGRMLNNPNLDEIDQLVNNYCESVDMMSNSNKRYVQFIRSEISPYDINACCLMFKTVYDYNSNEYDG